MRPQAPAEARWAAALDEAELAARDALDAGQMPPTTWPVPPGDLGPLPSTLIARAREVLALTDAAMGALATRRNEVAAELDGAVRRPSPFGTETPAARFVDQDA